MGTGQAIWCHPGPDRMTWLIRANDILTCVCLFPWGTQSLDRTVKKVRHMLRRSKLNYWTVSLFQPLGSFVKNWLFSASSMLLFFTVSLHQASYFPSWLPSCQHLCCFPTVHSHSISSHWPLLGRGETNLLQMVKEGKGGGESHLPPNGNKLPSVQLLPNK